MFLILPSFVNKSVKRVEQEYISVVETPHLYSGE